MTMIRTSIRALCAVAVATYLGSVPGALAESGESLFGVTSAGVTYGPYARVDIGLGDLATDEGDWLPPGYPSDPKVFFDLDADRTRTGTLAVGYDWMNGFRADIGLSFFGESDVDAPWSRTVPETEGPHADMSAQVRATALMANVFYSPFEAAGRNSRIQPYLTAGLGLARNSMEDWTRSRATSDRPVRMFEGRSSTDLAWSVGVGLAWQLNRTGRPIMLEAGYRYYDLGEVRGSSTPLPGNGTEGPVSAFGFDNRQHVVTIGLRIPLQDY